MKVYAEGDVMKNENHIKINQLEFMKQSGKISEEMMSLAQELLEDAKKDGDTYSEVISLYFISLYYFKNGDTELSLKPVTLANEISEKHSYIDYYVSTSNLLGIIYNSISEEFWGLEYFLKAYYASMKIKDCEMISRILNNIGDMFHELGDYKEAYNYLVKAKQYREQLENYKDEAYATILMNLIENTIMLERKEEVSQYIKEIMPSLSQVNSDILNVIIKTDEVIHNYSLGKINEAKEGIHFLFESVLDFEFTRIFNAFTRLQNIIIKLGDKVLGDTYIVIMKSLIDKIEDSKYTAKYHEIVISHYEFFGDKQQLFVALNEYYHFNSNSVITRKNNYSRSLYAKIELERAIHEHYEVLKRTRMLEILSEIDDLTGVYNRRTLEKKVLEHLSEKNKNCYYAMLVIDVDHFKFVNDSEGHILRDKLLRKMGALLKDAFRENSTIGRIGGDEFVVFIDQLGRDVTEAKKNITMILEAFQNKVRKVKLSDKQSKLSVSIGVALVKDRKKSFKFLYNNADTALYEAKNEGRNCFVCHELK